MIRKKGRATGKLLGAILDLGKEMLVTGGEVWRVEDLLESLFEAYCFREWDVWVVGSCIAATVETWDGREYTQIRSIKGRRYDLDKLELLYDLAEEVFETPTSVDVIREKVDAITGRPGLTLTQTYIATIMAGAGFTVFFNGGIMDTLVTAVMCVAFMTFIIHLGKSLNNLLAFNVIAAFIMETIALAALAGGIEHSLAAVTTAGILLLAGGIGITNGVNDFLHGDTLAGVGEMSTSLLGATGIAIGISISMILFRDTLEEQVVVKGADLTADPLVQLIACTVGCTGFVILYGARNRTLLFSAIGSFMTWFVYLFVTKEFGAGFFTATMISACFVALYGSVINAGTGIPQAIFMTSCVFPLLPGSNLYYAVFGAVSNDPQLFSSQGIKMLLVAMAIALGHITMDVLTVFIRILRNTYFTRA